MATVTKLTRGEDEEAARSVDSYSIDELRAMAQDLKYFEFHGGPQSSALKARYAELSAQAAVREQGTLRPVSPRDFSALGFAHSAYTAILPVGTPRESLADPQLWSVIPKPMLQPYTRIFAIDPAEGFVADVLVRAHEEAGELQLMVLNTWELPPKTAATHRLLPPKYHVLPVPGTAQHQVWYDRAPGDRIPIGGAEPTFEKARAAALQHAQTVTGPTPVYG